MCPVLKGLKKSLLSTKPFSYTSSFRDSISSSGFNWLTYQGVKSQCWSLLLLLYCYWYLSSYLSAIEKYFANSSLVAYMLNFFLMYITIDYQKVSITVFYCLFSYKVCDILCNMATSALLMELFTWMIFLQPLTLNLFALTIQMCFLEAKKHWIQHFNPFGSLCLNWCT